MSSKGIGSINDIKDLLGAKELKYPTILIEALKDIQGSVSNLLKYQGTHDAQYGTDPSNNPDTGDYWVISGGGNIDGTDYYINDWIVWNGTAWERVNQQGAPGGAISDDPYDGTWSGKTEEPATKNALYDKIETLSLITISDAVYGAGWNGVIDEAPSRNAVYDKLYNHISVAPNDHHVKYTDSAAKTDCVLDQSFQVGWDGTITHAPSCRSVYNKMESMNFPANPVSDSAYSSSWNGNTDAASKNALYDEMDKFHYDFGSSTSATYDFSTEPSGTPYTYEPYENLQCGFQNLATTVTYYNLHHWDTLLGESNVIAIKGENPDAWNWRHIAKNNYTVSFGTVEFKLAVQDITKGSQFRTLDVYGDESIRVGIRNGRFYAYNGASITYVGKPPTANTWYRIRIDIENTSGGYMGLSQYTYALWVDGIKLGVFAMEHNGTVWWKWGQFPAQSSVYSYYADIGFTTLDYHVGENQETGQQVFCDNINPKNNNYVKIGDVVFVNSGASQSDLVNAIAELTNGGRVVLPSSTISLSSAIAFNTGKSYILEGQGTSSILQVSGDYSFINITDASSVVIENVTFDSTNWTGHIYGVICNDTNNNPVWIRNCVFMRTAGTWLGQPVVVQQNNVFIVNNFFSDGYECIKIPDSDVVSDLIVDGNVFKESRTSALWCGLRKITGGSLTRAIVSNNSSNHVSSRATYEFNYIYASVFRGNTRKSETWGNDDALIGISNSQYNAISGNQAQLIGVGVNLYVESHYNAITGNQFEDGDENTIYWCAGIVIGRYWSAANCDDNLVYGNTCHNFWNFGTGNAWGIAVGRADCNNNTIVGNSCRGNETNYSNAGTATYAADNNTA